MRKHLIIALAVAGLAATTACGSKSSYRGVKANLSEKKVLPPVVDASVEQQALVIVNKDTQFQSTKDTVEATALRESIDAVSITVQAVGTALADSQAEVTMFTTENNETCVPTVLKSNEFDSKDISQRGAFVIKNVGRVSCIDKTCSNIILFVEKMASTTSVPKNTVFGTVAILMNKNDDGTYRPMSAESEIFMQEVEAIEDRVARCETDRAEEKGKDDANNAVRVNEIETRLAAIQDEINKLNNGQIAMGEAAREAHIEALRKEKTALETELATLKGKDVVEQPELSTSTPDLSTKEGKQARILVINERIKAIDTEIALHRGQKIFSDLNLSAKRIAELSAEKKNLESEKAGLFLYM